jgi:hypothetical protein
MAINLKNTTFYYKRDTDKTILTSGDKQKLIKGNYYTFFGKLYTDLKYTTKVADTIIIYKILAVNDKEVLIQTTNEYKFNNGNITIIGRILAKNFNMINNNSTIYEVQPTHLVVKNGKNIYKNAYGDCIYTITNSGIGSVLFNINLI